MAFCFTLNTKQIVLIVLYSNMLCQKPTSISNGVITIHRMDPDGCSHPCSPLHLVFTVAKPKSPTFTVKSSNRNISNQPLRIF